MSGAPHPGYKCRSEPLGGRLVLVPENATVKRIEKVLPTGQRLEVLRVTIEDGEFYCDMCSSAHPLGGEFVTVPNEMIADNALAYAEVLWDDMLREFEAEAGPGMVEKIDQSAKPKIIQKMVDYAKGQVVSTVRSPSGQIQTGEWLVCPEAYDRLVKKIEEIASRG